MELLDPDAEDVAQRAGVPAGADPVPLVGDAAAERDDQVPAVGGVPAQRGGRRVGQQVDRGDDHQPVAGQVGAGRGDVAADSGPPQRRVRRARHVQVADVR